MKKKRFQYQNEMRAWKADPERDDDNIPKKPKHRFKHYLPENKAMMESLLPSTLNSQLLRVKYFVAI